MKNSEIRDQEENEDLLDDFSFDADLTAVDGHNSIIDKEGN